MCIQYDTSRVIFSIKVKYCIMLFLVLILLQLLKMQSLSCSQGYYRGGGRGMYNREMKMEVEEKKGL